MTEQYPHPKNQFHIEEEVCPTDAKPKFISVEQNLNLMMALTHQTCNVRTSFSREDYTLSAMSTGTLEQT